MTEAARAARLRAAALAGLAGVALSLLGGIGGGVAAVTLWLAQRRSRWRCRGRAVAAHCPAGRVRLRRPCRRY
ncbi:hypothetical protein XPR_1842 [Xanthomonas arboricola pv. pruni MAFF 301420]|uniref:Uncharacterized protein n=1 Tax=Xanthomonas arboricola pv. pruni MAFF 301420 TaxID=1418095 RepID=W4SFN6_9XANT|nr:hypothetical protein XPR_1842 [Xanthomonas arboricola pv. pruni MAFF 301420]